MSRLDEILTALPDAVDWPEPSEHLATRVVSRIETGESRNGVRFRSWVWAAVGSVVILVALIPGTRQAVANLFQQAGVRIGFIEETPSDLGRDLQLGDPVTQQEAASLVEFDLGYPEVLGPPEGTYIDSGLVAMLWDGPILLTQRAMSTAFGEKLISPDTSVTEVQLAGGPALWIEGAEHSFTYLDGAGNRVEETTRLARNVLLWREDGVDHRLELSNGLDHARAIAESMEGAGRSRGAGGDQLGE